MILTGREESCAAEGGRRATHFLELNVCVCLNVFVFGNLFLVVSSFCRAVHSVCSL